MARETKLDARDVRILGILQRDGRRSYADIGTEVGMSGPSVFERVRKLEQRGIIRGHTVRLDPESVGLGVLAFSWVTQAPGTGAIDLTADFATIPEIEECHHMAGAADYLIKVRASDTRDLERVLRRVQSTAHVFSTDSSVVFSTGFERAVHVPGRQTDEAPEA